MTDDDRLAYDVAAYYRKVKKIILVMQHFHMSRPMVHKLLMQAKQGLLSSRASGSRRPRNGLARFLTEEQTKLAGHERNRAICENLSGLGMSVEQIMATTDFTRIAVEHHLETARLIARRANGRA